MNWKAVVAYLEQHSATPYPEASRILSVLTAALKYGLEVQELKEAKDKIFGEDK